MKFDQPLTDRFLLWIDAVGGYWVCQNDSIVLGRQDDPKTADVPIQGNLSLCHARLHRNGEGYLIEGIGPTIVDGRRVEGIARLPEKCQIQLGDSVLLRFHRSHALSGTARLDFLSHHSTYPSTDAIIWMSDMCILGPKRPCHIVCHHWPNEIVLYRNPSGLFCRSQGILTIDGIACDGRGRLQKNTRVLGEGLCFNLEAIH